MKLDNQTIMMVVVAIVLGMLVANMFKEVCGCKNLVEGQTSCTRGGMENCVWNREGIGQDEYYRCGEAQQPSLDQRNQLCQHDPGEDADEREVIFLVDDNTLVPGAPDDISDGYTWWNTNCCHVQPTYELVDGCIISG